MLGLELVVVLGTALLLCGSLARRAGVAPPVVQLAAGVMLGFVPQLRGVELPPETVLLVFLPALLWWESLSTSPREIRRDLRGIVLMGTLLVVFTAAAVAVGAHALGLAWGPAWILGAAVAPTDATAVGVLARSLPRRNVTLLQAESLVNDGTALVIYGLAVGIVVGGDQVSTLDVSWLFVVSYVGGVLAGLLTTWAGVLVRRRLVELMDGSVVMILVPFTAFLLAELVGASGVLAVVTAGLVMSQAGPRVGRADGRQQTQAFWTVSTYLLNGSLFVLVGIEAQVAVRALDRGALVIALVGVAVATVLVVASRFAFLFTVTAGIRLLDRRPDQQARRVSNRARVLSAMCGFRGAVSLAAALAVPTVLDSGAPFPERDVIVFVTAGVVVATLVVQGLMLPSIVRWARLPVNTGVDDERQLAQERAVTEALDALPELGHELGVSADVADTVRAEYEQHLAVLRSRASDADDDPAVLVEQQTTSLRRGLLARKRATVIRLRDEGAIDDTVLRQIQARLDVEEVRLDQHRAVE